MSKEIKINDIDAKYLITEEEKKFKDLFSKKGSTYTASRVSLRAQPRLIWQVDLLRRAIKSKDGINISTNKLFEKIVVDFIKRGNLRVFKDKEEAIKNSDNLFLEPKYMGKIFLSGINPFSKDKSINIQSLPDLSWSFFKILRLLKLRICEKPDQKSLLQRGEIELLNYISKDNLFWKKPPIPKGKGFDYKESELDTLFLLSCYEEWKFTKKESHGEIGSTKLVDKIIKGVEASQGYESETLNTISRKIEENKRDFSKNAALIKLNQEIGLVSKKDFDDYIDNITNKKIPIDDAAFNDLRFFNMEIKALYQVIEKEVII